MGKLPQYLFVIRHGNRLDAADKRWHLTSPTPYDPPLTYGGFLQARQVGNQIASILEQAKIEDETLNSTFGRKRKRFKVVIHSSPFLRCVQTSIGISAGIAQASPEALYNPSDVFLPAVPQVIAKDLQFKSTILRLDSFLGEWLSPEYFENITPPPGSALMLASAKADLLKRENYSNVPEVTPNHTPHNSASQLWNGSPTQKPPSPPKPPEGETSFRTSAMAAALAGQLGETKKGYVPLRPHYAVSGSGNIPDGFVAHARDKCVAIDYQWDSTRGPPVDCGDGGQLGEEWTAMHQRFRAGIKALVNWYGTDERPAELVSTSAKDRKKDSERKTSIDEEIETVVIVVSHGAGCNALIGAITHQPVLMDVGIASITMALRKEGVDYSQLAATTQASGVPVDQLYELRISASTEHLHSSASTPASTRSSSMNQAWNAGSRGRTSTFGATVEPVSGVYVEDDLMSSPGSRSTSASAAIGHPMRRESAPIRPSSRSATFVASSVLAEDHGSSALSTSMSSSTGLWAPVPSNLRLIDDAGSEEEYDDFAAMPTFDQSRFQTKAAEEPVPKATPMLSSPVDDGPISAPAVTGITNPLSPAFPLPSAAAPAAPASRTATTTTPVLAAPIKLNTNFGSGKPVEEIPIPKLGEGAGGLWGPPLPPSDAERFRDLSSTKRRWTVNEQARV